MWRKTDTIAILAAAICIWAISGFGPMASASAGPTITCVQYGNVTYCR